jgi:chromosome segregation ATPase
MAPNERPSAPETPPSVDLPGLVEPEDRVWGAKQGAYPDSQLNDVKWLRRMWAKARDDARRANEYAARLREENRSADSLHFLEISELQKTASKDMTQLRAQLVAVSAEFGGRLRDKTEELDGARGNVLALERRVDAAEEGKRRSDAAAKKQLQATATAAKEHAEVADKLAQDIGILRGKLFRCRERLEAANERANGAETRAAEGHREVDGCRVELQRCREEMEGCRAKRSAAIDQLAEYKERARAVPADPLNPGTQRWHFNAAPSLQEPAARYLSNKKYKNEASARPDN